MGDTKAKNDKKPSSSGWARALNGLMAAGLLAVLVLIIIAFNTRGDEASAEGRESTSEQAQGRGLAGDIFDIVVDSGDTPSSIVSVRAVSTDNIEVDVPARGGGWYVIRSRPNIRMCSIDKSSVEMQYQVNGHWLDSKPGGDGYVSAWRLRSRTDEPATYVYRWDSSRSCDTPIQD